MSLHRRRPHQDLTRAVAETLGYRALMVCVTVAVAFLVDHVSGAQYREEVDAVFADGDRAVNVAALVALLRDLDVTDGYPGFVVDELLGRQLAATIAGRRPLALLAEATFYFANVVVHGTEVSYE